MMQMEGTLQQVFAPHTLGSCGAWKLRAVASVLFSWHI
jgi:hypothetical protein